jgi:hypothetical protein
MGKGNNFWGIKPGLKVVQLNVQRISILRTDIVVTRSVV